MEGYELQVVVSISSSSFPPFCLPINSNNKHFNLQSLSQTTRTTSPSRLSHSNLSTSTSTPTASTPTNQPTNSNGSISLLRRLIRILNFLYIQPFLRLGIIPIRHCRPGAGLHSLLQLQHLPSYKLGAPQRACHLLKGWSRPRSQWQLSLLSPTKCLDGEVDCH